MMPKAQNPILPSSVSQRLELLQYAPNSKWMVQFRISCLLVSLQFCPLKPTNRLRNSTSKMFSTLLSRQAGGQAPIFSDDDVRALTELLPSAILLDNPAAGDFSKDQDCLLYSSDGEGLLSSRALYGRCVEVLDGLTERKAVDELARELDISEPTCLELLGSVNAVVVEHQATVNVLGRSEERQITELLVSLAGRFPVSIPFFAEHNDISVDNVIRLSENHNGRCTSLEQQLDSNLAGNYICTVEWRSRLELELQLEIKSAQSEARRACFDTFSDLGNPGVVLMKYFLDSLSTNTIVTPGKFDIDDGNVICM